MDIPSEFQIGSLNIYTFGIFVVLGYLFSLFVVWQESRRDGFNTQKTFDLVFLSSIVSFLFGRAVFGIREGLGFAELLSHVGRFWTLGIDFYGLAVGMIVSLLLFTKLWRWSTYRILDVFSLAASMGVSISVLGYVAIQKRFEFLFGFAFWMLLYTLFVQLRNRRLKSGIIFSLFLTLNVTIGLVFFRESEHLIFYGFLVTLSLVNLYFRAKKDAMKNTISGDVIKNLKDSLKEKDKRLEREEELLKEEDPYMVEDRDEGNADLEDEVSEDMSKEILDKKLSSIGKMRIQVKKALARIKIGKYGKCEVCGVDIDVARLKAYPEATTCLEHSNG